MMHIFKYEYMCFIFFAGLAINCKAQVGEYHYHPTWFSDLLYVLELNSDCNFKYEEHLKSRDSVEYGHGHGVIYWGNGTYNVRGDTLFLLFKPLPSGVIPDTIIETPSGPKTISRIYLSPPVFPWQAPPKPHFLIMRKNKLHYFSKKKLNRKEFYIIKNNSQFDLKKSTCR